MIPLKNNTKNQHYVWRHYLGAWATSDTFCCYRQRERKLFPTQPKVIANENYFYETQQLTEGDLAFLAAFIGKATDGELRKLNREYVDLTQLSFQIRDKLQSEDLHSSKRAELEDELRWIERNMIERYHSGIEGACCEILDSLRRCDDNFYRDERNVITFLYFLPLQYFRTIKMKEGMGSIASGFQGHDPRRTANILNHICATNVGAGLFRERNVYRIVFLQNETPIPFITGDQPVVNMLNPSSTDDVELYYPLSAHLAMVLTKDTVRYKDREVALTSLEVEKFNYAIYSKSFDQVYSGDERYLSSLVALDKGAVEIS